MPSQEIEVLNVDPDGFATKEQVADYPVAYSEKIDVPIRTGVQVTSVWKNIGRPRPRRRRGILGENSTKEAGSDEPTNTGV